MNITCAGTGDVLGKENGKSADGEIRPEYNTGAAGEVSKDKRIAY